jgi:deoxycytidylate deaminase
MFDCNYAVVYAVKVAILDAYRKGNNPAGAVLYTTLFPSNGCAQCIREAEISEVVYVSDKFRKTKFMKASRKLMQGIKCRYVTVCARSLVIHQRPPTLLLAYPTHFSRKHTLLAKTEGVGVRTIILGWG